MASKTCGATITTGDGEDRACALPPDHDGPIHTDATGHSWGDINLPLPLRDPLSVAE
jgi:hypothetical protein